jgi:hypothetical protein
MCPYGWLLPLLVPALLAPAERLFAAQSDQDRLRSVLVDMTKTSSDFRSAGSKALEGLADGLLPRLRPIMDDLGAVSTAVCCWSGC